MNRRRLQSLIDNPPPRSPYFTLPSVDYIDIYNTIPAKFEFERKKTPNTVFKIWGPARKMTEEGKTNFLASLLRFSIIDFEAMAKDKGIATGNQIKKRLSTIIGKEGYKLDGDQVVPATADGANQIIKTTEISVTENVPDDTPDDSLVTTNEDAPNPKAKKVTTKATAKPAKKRKRVDGKAPKEVLKKKQKKAVEQSMREGSA